MDKWEAQFSFWSSFGLPAYEENSTPDAKDISYPYITYEAVSATFDEDVQSTASIWTRSGSWLTADTISDTVEEELKSGGHVIWYGGSIANCALWVTPGTPFSQSMGDPEDHMIKRKRLSVILHF